MLCFLKRILLTALLVSLLPSACHTKAQQAGPPRIPEGDGKDSARYLTDADKSDDMQVQPDKTLEPVILNEAAVRHKCCQECSKAMAKDRTGDTAQKIPCTDFTADMSEECLKWHRGNKMKAAEAMKCAAEPPPKKKKSEDS